jgi:hypothetical protein
MRLLAQELESVLLLGHRVVLAADLALLTTKDWSEYRRRHHMDFYGLSLRGRRLHKPFRGDGGAHSAALRDFLRAKGREMTERT